MSKPKKMECGIPSVYRTSVVDHLLYGYAMGVLHTNPQVSVTKALLMFIEQMRLEDELDVEHARQIFHRFNRHFRTNGGL